jgi:hypothetical protein
LFSDEDSENVKQFNVKILIVSIVMGEGICVQRKKHCFKIMLRYPSTNHRKINGFLVTVAKETRKITISNQSCKGNGCWVTVAVETRKINTGHQSCKRKGS